jgi:hypothetical protein
MVSSLINSGSKFQGSGGSSNGLHFDSALIEKERQTLEKIKIK